MLKHWVVMSPYRVATRQCFFSIATHTAMARHKKVNVQRSYTFIAWLWLFELLLLLLLLLPLMLLQQGNE